VAGNQDLFVGLDAVEQGTKGIFGLEGPNLQHGSLSQLASLSQLIMFLFSSPTLAG
jgi:hypothetical protein